MRDPLRFLRAALPALAFLVLLGAVFWLQPRAMSYVGFTLMLNLAIPVIFATLAQMMVLTLGDLDLGIGGFVGFVACIAAVVLPGNPLLAILILLAAILVYGAVGALIQLRQLPSIVVTLGMSFVWFGLAVIVLPSPGGKAPVWLNAAMTWKPPYVPLPILVAAVTALVAHLAMMSTAWGAVARGAGGNARAVGRAGWSMLKIRVQLYMLAGAMGVIAGLALCGISTSADANIASKYTLLSIAGAILGGCSFMGGIISPAGAVLGALTMQLAGSALPTFLRLNPDWQVGVQGAILIVVLALRTILDRGGAQR